MADVTKILDSALPFFGRLAEFDKEYLRRAMRTVRVKKKGSVEGVFTVLSGEVRIYYITDSGTEITLMRLSRGGVSCAVCEAAANAIGTELFAEAERDSELAVIPDSAFTPLCQRSTDAKIFALENGALPLSASLTIIERMLTMSAEKRVALFLSEEHKRLASLTLRTTHENIAKSIGSAREVVSRTLEVFAKRGIISLSRGRITITNPAALYAVE